jgi:hypothetical protein
MSKKNTPKATYTTNYKRVSKDVPPTDEHYGFLQHFEEHGWAILPNFIPSELVDKAKAEIAEKLKSISDFDVNNTSTWGSWPFFNNGFCEFYHLPSFYEMRFYEPLYKVFTKLYNTEKIRVTVDRCCVKRPLYTTNKQTGKKEEHSDWYHKGFVHHDKNLITGECPIPIQCVISLDDTASNQGGWQGLNDFHKIAESWAQQQQNYKQKIEKGCKLPIFFPEKDLKHFELVRPAMGKGDVMVWHANVAHGSAPNDSVDKLRWAAYINFVPAQGEDKEMRRDYIECWATGRHPGRFDDKYSKLEMTPDYKPYPIETELQERLMGLTDYPAE